MHLYPTKLSEAKFLPGYACALAPPAKVLYGGQVIVPIPDLVLIIEQNQFLTSLPGRFQDFNYLF